MAQGGSLKFVVEVAADQATGALNAISQAVNQAGVKTKLTMLDLSDSTRKAGEAQTGLEKSVKSLKNEMVAGDRTINFFARSLNGIFPEASAAGQGIRLLADGIIGGVGLGFAVQAVMAGVQLFTKALEDNAKAAEEARKANKELDDLLAKSAMARARAEYAAAGGNVARFDAIMDRTQRESEIQEHRNRLIAELAKQQQILEKYTPDTLATLDQDSMQYKEWVAAKAEETRLLSKIGETDKALSDTRIADALTVKTDVMKQAGEEAKKAASAAEKVALEVAAARRRAEEAWARGTGFQPATGVFAKDDTSGLFGKPVTPRMDLVDKSTEAVTGDIGDRLKAQQAADRRLEAEAKKSGAEIGNAYVKPMVSTFAQGLGQMIQGQMTFRDLMRNLWSQIVQMVVQKLGEMLSTSITTKLTEANTTVAANAAEAASGAAASQASIPVIGPALAIGAMAAMLASVLALKGTYGSAAMGADLPMGGPFPMVLHKREMVLPEEHADTIRNLKAGAGGVNVYVTARNSRAAARDFLDNSREIARAVRKATRRAGA